MTTILKINTDKKFNLTSYPNKNKLSVYVGTLQPDVLDQYINCVEIVFKLDKKFCEILKNRMRSNNFSDQRVKDSVNYIFDNFKGDKIPKIADFINYDREIDMLSYDDIKVMINQDRKIFSKIVAIDTGLTHPKYIWKEDFEKYPYWKKWEAKRIILNTN